MKILFDGDMLVYRFCKACEERNPFDKTKIMRADPEETWRTIELRIDQCVKAVEDRFDEDVDITICFSSRSNYRKVINPSYKANRVDDKPVLYWDMKAKVCRLFHTEEWLNLEADDVMGILQNEDTVICSGDKDMTQIVGYHLSLIDPESGVYEVAQPAADFMFRTQCLSGDSTDGYYGCPGIGKTKAEAIISESTNWWKDVVDTYSSAMSPKTQRVKTEGGKYRVLKLTSKNLGLGEADALLTARMAYILRNDDDYNHETHEVKLWVP